ncbi:hypothetical protein CVT24_008129 [Panaeolus cyanescens]|uniref:CxC2-like cysteine cluster KDZ transposase-associated domain-containing protein n=1 Tax=Panaeolus cyanescens TaxID=181874 RepID=A0A409WCX5_9AGAR|nr:hypothetical protein CVT24_008129 [Panaeolus cyanescens]
MDVNMTPEDNELPIPKKPTAKRRRGNQPKQKIYEPLDDVNTAIRQGQTSDGKRWQRTVRLDDAEKETTTPPNAGTQSQQPRQNAQQHTNVPTPNPVSNDDGPSNFPFEPAPQETSSQSQRQSSKTQHDYIRQFIERIDHILKGTLSREAACTPSTKCSSSNCQSLAIWRCKDCFLSTPKCRSCTRNDHLINPFHRIECWTGTYFRPAWLHEVGVYLCVPHAPDSRPTTRCPDLQDTISLMERDELDRDKAEQKRLLADSQSPSMLPLDNSITNSVPSTHVPPETPQPANNSTPMKASFEDQLAEMLKGLDDDDELADEAEVQQDEVERQKAHEQNLYQFSHYIGRLKGKTDSQNPPKPISCVRVLHTNGIHLLELVRCSCRTTEEQLIDLCANQLLPSSFDRIQTLFTTPLLDFARLCNIELKSSIYQFNAMLRRLTDPMAPSLVANLYHEFRRMFRLWRWVKKLLWAGYGHKSDPCSAKDGELGNFCYTCPQPGLNLPLTWESDAANPIYRRTFVADGNFKADHIYRPGDDVALYDGAGMMPRAEEYMDWIKSAIEQSTKAPCENSFKAIISAMIASKSCDRTGIAAIACARHGCYAPNAIVDLFRGEQQKNVDYALLRALDTTHVDARQQTTLLYDIACQYMVHIQSRIGDKLQNRTLDFAIGLFHVHAHKDQCFFRFSPTFIPGLAVVIGEILESLWSVLNEVSIAARTATLAGRAEIIDDHASDSNHKKALNMIHFLCNLLVKGRNQSKALDSYFSDLNTMCSARTAEWTKQVEFAEQTRLSKVDVMDIYGTAKPDKTPPEDSVEQTCQSDTTTNEIFEYLELALFVEERQLFVEHKIKALQPGHNDENSISELRQTLTPLLSNLQRQQEKVHLVYADEDSSTVRSFMSSAEWDPEEDHIPSDIWIGDSNAFEKQTIALPSSGILSMEYAQMELELRFRQANMQLEHIRNLVAQRSLQFSEVSRHAPNTATKTRSHNKRKALATEISFHGRVYERCRQRMFILSVDPDLRKQYPELKKADTQASTAMLDPNQPGSTSARLSWIWLHSQTARSSVGDLDDNASTEQRWEFNRVHWMRARALSMRWSEEVALVTHEMSWTVRGFSHKSGSWLEDIENFNMSPGARAYALAAYGGDRLNAMFYYLIENDKTLDIEKKRWIQRGMREEHGFFLTFYGLLFVADEAQNIRVNSVYRAFADSLALADDTELPIPFDDRWKSNMIDNPAVHFEYHKQWWTQPGFPRPEDYLNIPSLSDALAYHKFFDEKIFEKGLLKRTSRTPSTLLRVSTISTPPLIPASEPTIRTWPRSYKPPPPTPPLPHYTPHLQLSAAMPQPLPTESYDSDMQVDPKPALSGSILPSNTGELGIRPRPRPPPPPPPPQQIPESPITSPSYTPGEFRIRPRPHPPPPPPPQHMPASPLIPPPLAAGDLHIRPRSHPPPPPPPQQIPESPIASTSYTAGEFRIRPRPYPPPPPPHPVAPPSIPPWDSGNSDLRIRPRLNPPPPPQSFDERTAPQVQLSQAVGSNTLLSPFNPTNR